jgi:hypothetical protein
MAVDSWWPGSWRQRCTPDTVAVFLEWLALSPYIAPNQVQMRNAMLECSTVNLHSRTNSYCHPTLAITCIARRSSRSA